MPLAQQRHRLAGVAETMRWTVESSPSSEVQEMQSRRSTLKGIVKVSIGAISYVSGINRYGDQQSLLASSYAAVDPVTAMTAAQAALSLVSAFTSSDGGMGAMLRAQRQMLVLVSQQLDDVIKALTDVRVRLANMPQLVADEAERSRLNGYYEAVISCSGTLKETGEAWFNSKTTAAVRQKLIADFRKVADDVRAARGALFVHPTLIAAAALPIALSTEVAARRLAGETDLLAPALNSYEQAIASCLDSTRSRSVAATLNQALRHHNELVAACSTWAGSPCSAYSFFFVKRSPSPVERVEDLTVTLQDGSKLKLGPGTRYRVRLSSCQALTHAPYVPPVGLPPVSLAEIEARLPLRVNNVHHYMWAEVNEAEFQGYKRLTLSAAPAERRVVDGGKNQCTFQVPPDNPSVVGRQPRTDIYDQLADGPFLVSFAEQAERGRVRLSEELWRDDKIKLRDLLSDINLARQEIALHAAATKLLLDTRERIQQVRATL